MRELRQALWLLDHDLRMVAAYDSGGAGRNVRLHTPISYASLEYKSIPGCCRCLLSSRVVQTIRSAGLSRSECGGLARTSARFLILLLLFFLASSCPCHYISPRVEYKEKKSIYLPVSCTAFLVVSVCVLLKSMCGVYRSDVRTWASTAPPLWLQDLRRKLKRSTLACTPEFFSFNAKVRRGSYHVTLRSTVGSPLVQQGFRFRHVAGISFAVFPASVKRMYEYIASERALWACSKSVRSLARML